MAHYQDLTLRNAGYVDGALQGKIRDCRLLIAGCGIGSTVAEAAARIGFERFILADGDRVEQHNLNRQAYCEADVGDRKTDALARRIRSINSGAEVSAIPEYIAPNNVGAIVAECDLVFDTIDFLDLNGMVSLHDEASRRGKPLISAASAGWGATLLYFPPDTEESGLFRRILGLPRTGPVENASYVEHFGALLRALAPRLSPEIVEAMGQSLKEMEDGTPCPAPHVSPGSYSVAALVVSCAVRVLSGARVTAAPNPILIDLLQALTPPRMGSADRGEAFGL